MATHKCRYLHLDDSISANDFVRKRNEMLLIFVATFLTITSTSTVHGPAAVDAGSTKHQQKQHSTSSTILSSADRSITIPKGLPISGSTRPVGHAHRHQRQLHRISRNSDEDKVATRNLFDSIPRKDSDHINILKDHIASPKYSNLDVDIGRDEGSRPLDANYESASKLYSYDQKDDLNEDIIDTKKLTSSEKASREVCNTPTVTLPIQSCTPQEQSKPSRPKFCAKGDAICIPANYSKFDLPNESERTQVNVGIDIKDIPKIDDKEFSITLNAFFVVRWTDRRMSIDQEKLEQIFQKGEKTDDWIPVDVSFIKEFWLPDAEILNLKEFKTLDVLSKLEGLWLNKNYEIMYAVATRITFICPMTFNSFPLDVQICKFQVGSFNYDINKMIFNDEFIADGRTIRSVLDYNINITKLTPRDQYYVALTGNYSVAGFELRLQRKVSHYIITYYLPSGMFVIVSWISFLVPPDIVPGRMTLLVTVFLVLVNIFNTITTNIPKAEGLTAIEAWVIVCVLFVFGALIEYAGVLLKVKLGATRKGGGNSSSAGGSRTMSRENSVVCNNGNTMAEELTKQMSGHAQEKRMQLIRCATRKRQKEDQSHAKLDILFLMLFPLFFLIFNVIYWTSFLYAPCQVGLSSPTCDDPVGENIIGVGAVGNNDNPSTSSAPPAGDLDPTSSSV